VRRARKAWNGGSVEAAMAAATERAERAIAADCPRCPTCEGAGLLPGPVVCATCGAAGYLVPEGSMPAPPACEHAFEGWREFEDGNGGERMSKHCGLGAMAHTLSLGI